MKHKLCLTPTQSHQEFLAADPVAAVLSSTIHTVTAGMSTAPEAPAAPLTPGVPLGLSTLGRWAPSPLIPVQ